MGVFYVPIRRSVYLTLGQLNKLLLPRLHNNIFILCYHAISNDGWDFSVKFTDFKKQMDYLSDKYEFISLKDLNLYLSRRKKIEKPSVVITFDDGFEDILQVKSYLSLKHIKPTVFIISDTKNIAKNQIGVNKKYLSNGEIKELIDSGWEVGSHTKTHPAMNKLNQQDIVDEIAGSKSQLENKLGIPIKYIAYPKGVYNSEILTAVKGAGYELGLTMDDSYIDTDTDPIKVPRIGVDGTHSFAEFKVLSYPLVSEVRKFLKTFVFREKK